jgi:hypothetical protein
MAKNKMLKLLNPILAILILTQALSALLADHLSHDVFEVVHEGGGVVLVLGIVLHVILNFAWVRTTYRRRTA